MTTNATHDCDADLDAVLGFDDAVVDARRRLEHERCVVWLPSFFDVDPETKALSTEIARLRADNRRLMDVVHAKADRLPDDMWTVYRDILDASGIRDHDSARADVRYREWCAGGRRGPKPTSMLGGRIDAMAERYGVKRPSCLYECFRRAMRGARTWRDVSDVLPYLAECLDVDRCVLPDDVYCRHVAQDAAIAALEGRDDDG